MDRSHRAFDLSLGFALPGATVSLGGTLLYGKLVKPGVELSDGINRAAIEQDEIGESNSDSDIGLILVGPFVDVFFSPRGGGHVDAVLGGTNLNFEDERCLA